MIPYLVTHPLINLRNDPSFPKKRQEIEFLAATPLEYLERWIAVNDVFGDDVLLSSVIQWADQQVSIAITQPQYHGTPASFDEIDRFFKLASWTPLPSVSGHTLYYNYAFQVLAIDALPRNCYVHENALLPFDVILCRPDEEMERFLKLYPE